MEVKNGTNLEVKTGTYKMALKTEIWSANVRSKNVSRNNGIAFTES